MKHVLWILTFFIIISHGETVNALSCVDERSYIEKYQQADLVFKGKLLSHGIEKYTFQIDYSLKEKLSTKYTFYDAIPPWLDEYIEDGKTYLIFAKKNNEKQFTISPCGDTVKWSEFLFFLVLKVFMWVFAVFILLNLIRAWKEGEVVTFFLKHRKNLRWLIGIVVFVIVLLSWPL